MSKTLIKGLKISSACAIPLMLMNNTSAATKVIYNGSFQSNRYGITGVSNCTVGASSSGTCWNWNNFGCKSECTAGWWDGADRACRPNCSRMANSSLNTTYAKTVTFTASSNYGWRWAGGQTSEKDGSGSETRTLTLSSNERPGITSRRYYWQNPTQITYLAVDERSTYTVSYNANGGSGAPSAQEKIEGVNLTLSSTKPTRANHTFLGWSTSSTATSATYSAGGTYTANAGATLYAVWKVNGYNLNYNLNGGSCSTCTNKTLQTNLPNPIPTPTKRGYNFGGWFTNSGLTTKATPGAAITSNTTLYAKWAPITYTVEYSLNGGTGTASNQTVNYNATITINKGNQISRRGYVFSGWKDPTGSSWTDWSGTWTYINGQYGITGNKLVLTAQWTPITYTVEYDLNGGTGTAPTQTVNYDATITINNGNQISKTGYVFSGWKDPTGDSSWTNWTGTWAYVNGQYGITGNKLVLTAQWTRSWNRYAVDCIVDSSGNIMQDSSTIGPDSAYKTQTLYFDIPVEDTGSYNFCFAKSAATKTINNHNGYSSGVYYWENDSWVKK